MTRKPGGRHLLDCGAFIPSRVPLNRTDSSFGISVLLVCALSISGARVGSASDHSKLDCNGQTAIGQNKTQEASDGLSVLLLDPQPTWEYRLLNAMLHRDADVELTSFQASPGSEEERTVTELLGDRDRLADFDVIILAHWDLSSLTADQCNNLLEFVAMRGGGLVIIAGPEFTAADHVDTPIAALLPIDCAGSESFDEARATTIEPTDAGNALAAFDLGGSEEENRDMWRGMPDIYTAAKRVSLKDDAKALAVIRDPRVGESPIPVIISGADGDRHIVFSLVDDTWRWRAGSDRLLYQRFWLGMLDVVQY